MYIFFQNNQYLSSYYLTGSDDDPVVQMLVCNDCGLLAVTKFSEIFADNFRWKQLKTPVLIVKHSQSFLIASFCS